MFRHGWLEIEGDFGPQEPKGPNGHALWDPAWTPSFVQTLLGAIGGTPKADEVLMELDPSPGLLRWAAESGAHWIGLQQSLQPAKVAWLEGQIGELAHSKLTAATADDTDRVLQDKLAMLEVEGLGVAK